MKPTPEHKRLDPFVGTWRTEGEVLATSSSPAATFRATDIYEWLAGGFFLIHRFDAQMPDGETKGIEIIGFDDASGTYPMTSFDNHGSVSVMHAKNDGDRWTFSGEAVRFTGGFQDEGKTFAGVWERRADGGGEWLPWMRVVLTRE